MSGFSRIDKLQSPLTCQCRLLSTIEDLRLMAMRRLPRMVFDYIDGGAEREWTLRENSRAFQDVLFRPRSAVATRSCDITATVLGTRIDLPIVLAPVGSSRMFYPRGEEEAAARRRRGGHHLYVVHALGLPARGCESRDQRQRVVPAVPGGRTRCGA